MGFDLRELVAGVQEDVIGRKKEARVILAALAAGRDLLLEGPPGTSKSTLLRAIAARSGRSLHFVEGNADLTPAKLVGHHSPARVVKEGYTDDTFVPGPLPLAMKEGGLLYLEELNRVPEDTLNALISAMAERELMIPRAAKVRAADGFRVIAAMNPFDNIGTGRLSGALTDRLCRVRLGYQTEEEERAIVARRAAPADALLVKVAVRTCRLSREHKDLRMGGSVRAAIDFARIAHQLGSLEDGFLYNLRGGAQAQVESLLEAARAAISVKIAVREASKRSDEELVDALTKAAFDQILIEDYGETPPSGGPPPGGSQEPPPEPGGGEQSASPDFRGRGTVPESSMLQGGDVISSDDAEKKAGQRPPGDRRLHAIQAERPDIAEALADRGLDTDELMELVKSQEDALELLGDLVALGDNRRLRELARRLAGEIIIETARRDVAGRAGRGRLTSVRFSGDCCELDLERTLEALAGDPFPKDDDFFVFERRDRSRSYALMLDISGSMTGSKIFNAALALASVAIRVRDAPVSVIAFWHDAAVLKPLSAPMDLEPLLDRLLSLNGRGLTDVGTALEAALGELGASSTQEKVAILFSDGMQNAGRPAEELAPAFDTLHVVGTGEASDAESRARCEQLAALGHGRCAMVHEVGSIGGAITQCLG
jgi:MoxR-like ATPase/Mg-chelatase subunit ChlD